MWQNYNNIWKMNLKLIKNIVVIRVDQDSNYIREQIQNCHVSFAEEFSMAHPWGCKSNNGNGGETPEKRVGIKRTKKFFKRSKVAEF